jgi:GTPase SAR1 family protein
MGDRYVKGKLPTNKPSTIGVEFATKNVELKNGAGVVKAQIWDTGKRFDII